MSNILKWLWERGHQQAMNNIRHELQSMQQYHRQQAELAYLKDKHEPENGEERGAWNEKYQKPRLTPKEHSHISDELHQLEKRLFPEEYDESGFLL